MATTIQVSEKLLHQLQKLKIYSNESYEDLIWDILEDRMELSEETKKNISESEKDIKSGRVHKWEDIKREFSLNV
jgi:predicted transcriptional regulator